MNRREAKTISLRTEDGPTNGLLSIARIVPCTEAEGPGRRFAVWFQGCPLRCRGCCNPEMLPFSGGTSIPLAEVVRQVAAAAADPTRVEGVSLLGGEPTAHPMAADLAEAVQALGLTVMVYSGFKLTELQARGDAAVDRLLAATDLLVDGPYEQDHPETERRWIGSTNQDIHFLTSRYSPDDPAWRRPNTLEIRLENGVLTVNGFPAPQAREFWRRPPAPIGGKENDR
ncbi:MAG: 4Fe-4S single cluster domain-containing protein [Planctomycetia bacterium]